MRWHHGIGDLVEDHGPLRRHLYGPFADGLLCCLDGHIHIGLGRLSTRGEFLTCGSAICGELLPIGGRNSFSTDEKLVLFLKTHGLNNL